MENVTNLRPQADADTQYIVCDGSEVYHLAVFEVQHRDHLEACDMTLCGAVLWSSEYGIDRGHWTTARLVNRRSHGLRLCSHCHKQQLRRRKDAQSRHRQAKRNPVTTRPGAAPHRLPANPETVPP